MADRNSNRALASIFGRLPLLALPLAAFAAACTENGDDTQAPPVAAGALFTGLPQVCTQPADFPAGFDYPQTAATIAGWVTNRDEAAMRAHGWYLWAGLNAASGDQPVWRGWCTSTQAFADNARPGPVGEPQAGAAAAPTDSAAASNAAAPAADPNAAAPSNAAAPPPGARAPFHRQRSLNAIRRAASGDGSGEDPINLPGAPAYLVPQQVQDAYPRCYVAPPRGHAAGNLVDGPTFQSNGDIMIAGVIYNQPAFQWIRSRSLFSGPTLDGFLPAQPTGIGRMPEMPPGSIVLKPMMWPVAGDGYTALPLWDDLPPDADQGRYAGFEVQRLWPRAVAVTPRPQGGVATADVTYLHNVWSSDMLGRRPVGPITYSDAPVVGLDRFYAFGFSEADLQAMDPCDRALLDASAWWAYNRPFRAGDYLALVAMHVMTREQPAWTFQSVWWHDRPEQGPYAANRPDIPASQAPGPWRHYLMASTYGMPAEPNGTSWPIAFNPYIELAADHPIRTNCMNCHHRAAWPRSPRTPSGSYEAPSPPGPDALAIFTLDNPIFQGLALTDAMWAIPDRAHEPAAAGGAGNGGGATAARR